MRSAATPAGGSTATAAPPARTAAGIDPETVIRIKHLELRAKVVVEGFISGIHRSPFHGVSVEFTEYRQYTPGDDPRFVDWKLFARSDRFYIKRYEDETNLRCTFVVDFSRSMGYGSLSFDKAEYARTAAATLAYFLVMQRDAVGLMTFDEEVRNYLPARYRPGHLHRVIMALEQEVAGTDTRMSQPLERVAQVVTKRGLIVIISDLLTPLDRLAKDLGYLRSRGHEVVIVRVLDPSETSFDFTTPAMFLDHESGKELYIDPDVAREQYLRRFRQHAADLQTICDDLGIDLIIAHTNQPLDVALFDFLQARMRRGRSVIRRGMKNVAGKGGGR
ncbi:MAG: DUF58 domain-containing protein [Pirellulaceae bacterium]